MRAHLVSFRFVTCAIISLWMIMAHVSFSQTLEEYFSMESLSLNAVHMNQYTSPKPNAYTYLRKDTACGVPLLVYVSNSSGHEIGVEISDRKVYTYSSLTNCNKVLLYDFGLEIGESLGNQTLYDKHPITLLNGEIRMAYELSTSGFLISDTWIEGIGSIRRAFIGQPDFEGYDAFVCAKAGDVLLWEDPTHGDKCDSYSCLIPQASVSTMIDGFTLTTGNETIFGTQHVWDFGDGVLSTEITPTHIYEDAGCYILTYSVGSDCAASQVRYTRPVPVCFGEAWKVDYVNDTFSIAGVYRYSDSLEFYWNGITIFRSSDAQHTWTRIQIPEPPTQVSRIISTIKMFDAQNGVLLCRYTGNTTGMHLSGIYITHDGGNAWQVKAPDSYSMSRLTVTGDGRAWALGSHFYRTLDYGETWEDIPCVGFDDLYSIDFVGGDLLVGRGYKGVQPWGTYVILHSSDNGTSWSILDQVLHPFATQFVDKDHGYCNHSGQDLYSTEDGGLTWDMVPLPFTTKAFEYATRDTGWLLDDVGRIHYTTDRMQSFLVSSCGSNTLRSLDVNNGLPAYGIFENKDIGTSPRVVMSFSVSNIHPCVYPDTDLDGTPDRDDCNPNDPTIYPGADEIPDNGIDEDCDGKDLIRSTAGLDKNIGIYPNPVHGILTVNTTFPVNLEMRVFDASAREVIHVNNTPGSLDLTSLSPGCYFLRITDIDTRLAITRKVMVY